NTLSPNIEFPSYNGKMIDVGFKKESINFKRVNGLLKPNGFNGIGPDHGNERPTPMNTGVSWYPKQDYRIQFNTGKEINVKPGENTLIKAIENSNQGDILVLESGQQYHQSKSINILHPLSIRSNGKKSTITFERSSLFNLENGGSLTLKGLEISGSNCNDYAGNSVIRTSRFSMINNYKLIVEDCNFIDLDVNHSFNVLKIYKNTFADSIKFLNCNFNNVTGHVLNMNKETDDIGIYNVENVMIENCTFKEIGGAAINLYRGGKDESTFGPMLTLKHSTFENVGFDKRNKVNAAVSIHGVQFADMANLKFRDCKKLNMHLVVGDPVIKLSNVDFENCEKMTSNDNAYERSNIKLL
ncbi:MAG: DUF4957 domain-containing protein, partial [Bacteroidota bacterium]